MVPETFHCTKQKRVPKKIHTLHHYGRIISQQEEIVQVMQQWYEETAEHTTPQARTLQEFLTSHDIKLPQITEDQKDMLDDKFTITEVQDDLKDANDVRAPSPSGHNIVFYKLLFANIPNIMTQAINQMVFVTHLDEKPQFKWIQHRKVVYIPKKPGPTRPSAY